MKKTFISISITVNLVLAFSLFLLRNDISQVIVVSHLIYHVIFLFLSLNLIFFTSFYRIKKIILAMNFLFITLVFNFLEHLEIAYYTETIGQFQYLIETFFALLTVIFLALGLIEFSFVYKNKTYYDPFTNLPNKNYIIEKLPSLLNLKKTQYAFIYIDIDKFNVVNINLGFSKGNAVLKEISERLNRLKTEDIIVTHFLSDEFILIIRDIKDKDLNEIIENIKREINRPIIIDEQEMFLTAGVGIALSQYEDEDINTLINYADIAKTKAKQLGNNMHYYSNIQQIESVHSNILMENELKKAIKDQQFTVYYQPKINITTNEVSGFEALIRWIHPTRGMILPGYFIHVAEFTKQIHKLDYFVLRSVCMQLKAWQEEGVKPYKISVNISPFTFLDERFIKYLDDLILEYKIDSSYLGVEITESVAMQDMKQTIEILHRLKKRKINVLIDDFGKGFSSLHYIKSFPIDVLKIDKMFIDGIKNDSKDEAIVKTVINLAKMINVSVIAEGVESEEQVLFLKEILCDEYQGYLVSPPKPIEEFKYLFN